MPDKQSCEPITLTAVLTTNHWTVYSDGHPTSQTMTIPAVPGRLPIEPFSGCTVESVADGTVTLRYCEKKYELRPGDQVRLSRSVEGREYSDGCIYDGYDYTLTLTLN